MNKTEACRAAGTNSMFVVNHLKALKKEGLSHDCAHLLALKMLKFKREEEGKNTKYVDSRISFFEWLMDLRETTTIKP